MKCTFRFRSVATAAALAVFGIVPAFGQGSLTPTGPPAPTMKTLDQMEPRKALAAGLTTDHTISAPGSYYLTGNVRRITIDSSDVILDLNGYSVVVDTNNAAFYAAVSVNGNVRRGNIVIKNGAVVGPVVPTYTGPNPWQYTYADPSSWGIYVNNKWVDADSNFGQNLRLENLVVKNFSYGIYLASFDEFDGGRIHLANCTVRDCSQAAMWFDHGIVRDCLVQRCGSDGLRVGLSTVENVIIERAAGNGIVGSANTIRNNVIRFCGGDGINSPDSTLADVTVSGCVNGISSNNSSVERATVFSNRSHGFNGSGNSIANSVFRSNTGTGVNGPSNTLKNLTASNNTGSGIAGDGVSVDGAVANSNGAHGIVGNGSTVRGVRASGNSGAGVYCDDSTINECMTRDNGADGIRGVNSTINNCRSVNNDTNKTDGYTASDIYWFGGRQQGNVAGSYAPSAPGP
jgi:hypothetical protein